MEQASPLRLAQLQGLDSGFVICPKVGSILKGIMRGRVPWCSGFEDGRG